MSPVGCKDRDNERRQMSERCLVARSVAEESASHRRQVVDHESGIVELSSNKHRERVMPASS